MTDSESNVILQSLYRVHLPVEVKKQNIIHIQMMKYNCGIQQGNHTNFLFALYDELGGDCVIIGHGFCN